MDPIKPAPSHPRTLRSLPGFLLIALLLVAPSGVVSQKEKGDVKFQYPSEGQIFHQLDSVNVTYTSIFADTELFAFCNPENVRQIFNKPVPGPNGSYIASIDFTSDQPCWFNLRNAEIEGPHGGNSPWFNVLGQKRPGGPQLLGLKEETGEPTSSSIPAPSSTAPSNSNITDSPASPGSSEEGDNSGLSSGAAVGIGVGVAIGVLAMAGGFVAWWWRGRRQRKSDGAASAAVAAAADGELSNHYTPYDDPNHGLPYKPSATPDAAAGVGGGGGVYKLPEHQSVYAELSNTPVDRGPHEVDGQGRQIPELGSSNVPAEMPAR